MGLLRKLIVCIVLVLIYLSWFDISKTVASGDWQYLFKETIEDFSFSPDTSYVWLGPYYQITSKIFVQYLHIPWELTEKIWWFWLFLIISFFSSLYLSKVVLKESRFSFLSVLIFLSNTYILMIVGGGQAGIPLAYAFFPAVLASFIEFMDRGRLQVDLRFLKFAFLFSVQLMFDPRISYIMILSIILYLFFAIFLKQHEKKNSLKSQIFYLFFLSFALSIFVFIINSPWIIKRFISTSSDFFVDPSSGSLESLKFFSFASFSDALSLLHPNWPENIFGKVYFMRSEFILLPILAYSSLFFVSSKINPSATLRAGVQNLKNNIAIKQNSNRTILFFTVLGLIGAFLAKGSNPPFAFTNEFLFKNFPGMSMFRDPTKFYVLTVLSYSILIPYTLERIAHKISFSRLNKTYTLNSFYVLFLVFWCFLIRQSLFGELKGTFRSYSVPSGYISFKNFLLNDSNYSPVLWLPTHSPFAFYSKTHPFVDATHILGNTSPSKTSMMLDNEGKKKLLIEKKIKYIIVPEDIEGKFFLADRKYSEKEYRETIKNLKKISFLTLVRQFDKIMVFQVSQ